MLRWLERTLGRYAISNLTMMLIAGQGLTFLVSIAQPTLYQQMVLIPARVLDGEVWRLLTFVFLAPLINPAAPFSAFSILFFLIELQLLWLFGSALDQHWGSFRYNLFLLVGYVGTVAASFLVPQAIATNGFLYGTVFLAFAFLYPDYILHLFFILPVKVKWLALLAWAGYGFAFLAGGWMTRVVVAASVANFFLFFGRDLADLASRGFRRARRKAQASAAAGEAFHTCMACGRTDQTDPKLEFRYCPKCTGAPCYCLDHIHDHDHR